MTRLGSSISLPTNVLSLLEDRSSSRMDLGNGPIEKSVIWLDARSKTAKCSSEDNAFNGNVVRLHLFSRKITRHTYREIRSSKIPMSLSDMSTSVSVSSACNSQEEGVDESMDRLTSVSLCRSKRRSGRGDERPVLETFSFPEACAFCTASCNRLADERLTGSTQVLFLFLDDSESPWATANAGFSCRNWRLDFSLFVIG